MCPSLQALPWCILSLLLFLSSLLPFCILHPPLFCLQVVSERWYSAAVEKTRPHVLCHRNESAKWGQPFAVLDEALCYVERGLDKSVNTRSWDPAGCCPSTGRNCNYHFFFSFLLRETGAEGGRGRESQADVPLSVELGLTALRPLPEQQPRFRHLPASATQALLQLSFLHTAQILKSGFSTAAIEFTGERNSEYDVIRHAKSYLELKLFLN